MNFKKALEAMMAGAKVKLPTWGGYWYWDAEKKTIMLHLKDGSEMNIREMQDVAYTMSNIAHDDWMIADEENCPELGGVATFGFGDAIRLMKRGLRVARQSWNGKGQCVAYQKGYPEGIPCNKNTADAWGMQEGDLFRCRPYFQLRCVDGSFQMWFPSVSDCLGEDWYIVE